MSHPWLTGKRNEPGQRQGYCSPARFNWYSLIRALTRFFYLFLVNWRKGTAFPGVVFRKKSNAMYVARVGFPGNIDTKIGGIVVRAPGTHDLFLLPFC